MQNAKDAESGVSPEKMEGGMRLQIEAKLIPVPRILSSSCGTALSVEVKDALSKDIAFLFECEHDEIYTLNAAGEYHLENECC